MKIYRVNDKEQAVFVSDMFLNCNLIQSESFKITPESTKGIYKK